MLAIFLAALLITATPVADQQGMDILREEIRQQLATLPSYGLFDWLQADVKPDGTVILTGSVRQPMLKEDAEARIKTLGNVLGVINNVEVLPLLPADDDLRLVLYRAVFGYDSPFLRYAMESTAPPIHIVVK